MEGTLTVGSMRLMVSCSICTSLASKHFCSSCGAENRGGGDRRVATWGTERGGH